PHVPAELLPPEERRHPVALPWEATGLRPRRSLGPGALPTVPPGSSHRRATGRTALPHLAGRYSCRDRLLRRSVYRIELLAAPQVSFHVLPVVQVVLNGRLNFFSGQLRQVALDVGHAAAFLEAVGDVLDGDS